jgi:hypothetical protein
MLSSPLLSPNNRYPDLGQRPPRNVAWVPYGLTEKCERPCPDAGSLLFATIERDKEKAPRNGGA